MKNTMRSRLLALTYKDVTQTGVLTAFRWSLGTPSCRRRSHATRHIPILEASTGLPPCNERPLGIAYAALMPEGPRIGEDIESSGR